MSSENTATAPAGYGAVGAEMNERAAELSDFLSKNFSHEAKTLIIAGSGLGGVVRAVNESQSLSYADIPHVGASTVAGHAGRLIAGRLAGFPVVVMQGRRHLYEGISAQESTLLLRSLLIDGRIRNVVVSNAAGGLNPTFQVGDLMLIADHINLMFRNALLGPNRDEWGPRFPDASEVFSRRLRALAREAATQSGVTLREGVYVAGLGPNYETRAETRMLRVVMGADAVGMSTVHEALLARHMDREVLGLSFISNVILEPGVTTHDEVVENSRLIEGPVTALLSALIPKL